MLLPTLAAMAVGLAALPRTHGLIVSGSINGNPNPFLAKFAFGVDATGAPVGNVKLTYTTGEWFVSEWFVAAAC